jgi:hypothetical protein
MSGLGTLAVLAGVASVISAATFFKARDRARASGAARTGMIWRSVVGLVLGPAILLLGPRYLPMNVESPAAILVFGVCWIIGGGLLLLSGASLAGALAAGRSV